MKGLGIGVQTRAEVALLMGRRRQNFPRLLFRTSLNDALALQSSGTVTRNCRGRSVGHGVTG